MGFVGINAFLQFFSIQPLYFPRLGLPNDFQKQQFAQQRVFSDFEHAVCFGEQFFAVCFRRFEIVLVYQPVEVKERQMCGKLIVVLVRRLCHPAGMSLYRTPLMLSVFTLSVIHNARFALSFRIKGVCYIRR